MSNEKGKLGRDLHHLGVEVSPAIVHQLYKMGWRKRGSKDDTGPVVVQMNNTQSFAQQLFTNPHGTIPMQPKLPGSWITGV